MLEGWATQQRARFLRQGGTIGPRLDLVRAINERLAAGTPLVLSVGLGRPYKKLGETVWRHWLQANNLHLADDPLWQEGTTTR